MYLSDYVNKPILVGKEQRGVCLGVGFSLKSQALKCLLCAPAPQQAPTFAVSISAVKCVTEHVALHRLRTVLPTGFARLTLGMPIYAHDGGYLGKIIDAELANNALLRLFTDKNECFPATAVFACNDALILRKNLPYPLGQRVPAPVLCQINDKTDGLVTRPLLRTAIAKGALIKLTLSLPPFRIVEALKRPPNI